MGNSEQAIPHTITNAKPEADSLHLQFQEISFPFKNLKDLDTVIVTLAGGKKMNGQVLVSPKKDPSETNLHSIYLRVSGEENAVGELVTQNLATNAEAISLKDFMYCEYLYDSWFMMGFIKLDAVPIAKIVKVVPSKPIENKLGIAVNTAHEDSCDCIACTFPIF